MNTSQNSNCLSFMYDRFYDFTFEKIHAVSRQKIFLEYLFLKVHSTENIQASISNVDDKTFRKWSCPVVEKLSELKSCVVFYHSSLY